MCFVPLSRGFRDLIIEKSNLYFVLNICFYEFITKHGAYFNRRVYTSVLKICSVKETDIKKTGLR
jgi:hypothetical protein